MRRESPNTTTRFLTDITERKRAGEAQRRLAQFPEENPNAVLRIDHDGTLLYANAAARTFLEAMSPAAGRSVPASVLALAAEARRREHEVEDELDDQRGRTFWFAAAQPPGERYVNLYGRNITLRRQAEQEVRRNREWLRVTLSSIGDGVIACDAQGLITFINPAAATLAGWAQEDALGQPIRQVFQIISEATHQPAEDLVARVLRERRSLALANHTALVAKDGREIPIEDSAAPILDDAGNLAGAVIVFHDVTQKRRAQEELRESESQFRDLANAIPQLCWMANADGWIFWYNRRWYEYTGATPEQMEGWGWQSAHDPEALPKVLESWGASIATGKPFDMVFPLRGADGVFRPFLTRGMPLYDRDGKVIRWFGTNTDISEQRKIEEALRESEGRYRSLFRNMAEGFALHEIITNPDGTPCDYRFLDVNPGFERLTGLAAADLIGRTVREALPGIEPYWIEKFGSVALTGEPATFESYAGPLDRWYEVFAYRPSPQRFAVVFMDITDRKSAEDRLRETQKLESIGLLAGGIAHDFNNLLVGVIGNASLAQDLAPPAARSPRCWAGILKTGEQLAHLTRQMLAYSGKGRFFLEPLNLSDLIRDMRALVQPSIPKKIELRLELERGLPSIEADRGQMQQVFMNLVLNAAEAIGAERRPDHGEDRTAGGELAGIRQPSLGQYVYLEVRDTGCGMDDATKAKIFDPFFSTKFVGRGLGLAAVSGIVRGHKGAMTVTSSPGKGSCFTILLPVTEHARAVAPLRGR